MSNNSLKEKTAKGLLWGGISNGIQQLLNLLFGIFLSRILSRTDYGMIGMLSIFSLIASSIQESGFTAALTNKKDIQHKDYNAVFWFSSLMGLLLYAILSMCSPLIARFYDTPELESLSRYSFLCIFISSLGTAQSAFLYKNLMVRQRTVTLNISLAVSGITGVVMALNGFAYWGIATQNLVYVTCVTCLYWYHSPWRPSLKIDFSPLKNMISFSGRLLLTNIFANINNNILSVLLGKYYSGQEVGDFNQANKWNYMGYSVITGTIYGVAQPVLSKVGDDKERQKRIFRKMLRLTSLVAFPAMFGLSITAYELITIAITSKWSESAYILHILCIGSAFTSISYLYSNLIISKGKSRIFMWSTIVQGITQTIIMILCHPYGIPLMIKLYVGINIAWLAVWQYFVWKEIGLSLMEALKDVLPYLTIAALTMTATAYIVDGNISNIYLSLISKIIIAGILYLSTVWLCGSVTLKESYEYLVKKKIN